MTDTAPSNRCVVCGGALILGECALHGSPRPALTAVPSSSRTPDAVAPPRPLPRGEATVAWPMVVVILFLLVLVGGLGIVWRTTEQIQADQRGAIAEQDEIISRLRAQVAGQQELVDGADARLAALETKTGSQTDAAAVAAQVQPSVWTVETPGGVGSGFFLGEGAASRQLVTNYHVVADVWEVGGRRVVVRGENGQQMDGTIERVHEYTDLALVSVDFDQPPLKRAPDLPKPGDGVVVVGSPLGLGGSVSSGIVSAIRVQGGEGLIQFSAAVSPGSSGGPVVDGAGRVIGVTVSKAVGLGAEGLSFAIPVSDICTSLEYCD